MEQMTLSLHATDINPEAMRLIMGIDPARDADTKPLFNVQYDSLECPVVVPHKRRGLTGKRYRIARRRYHRQMKAWKRGEIEPQQVRRVLYNVGIQGVEQVPGGTFSTRMGVVPNVEYDPWFNLTMCDYNPGKTCMEIANGGSGHCCREYEADDLPTTR